MLQQRAPFAPAILVEGLYPPALFGLFLASAGVLLVYPAFGRLRRHAGTASSLRLSAPRRRTLPSSPFLFFLASAGVLLLYPAFGRVRRCWTASTLRPSASSLDSECPSPKRVVAGQRAPFARGYHAGTTSTLRLIDRAHHAGTASTLRFRDHRRSTLPPALSFLFALAAVPAK